ncbi:unnamed protein product [Amoebophrya sp. A25]|nr:unnamed protein product [Amoebophrya sp. A25]|eukprot:GSA25T00008279001.1
MPSPSPPPVVRYPKILCFGDSLTQGGTHNNEGWVIRLQRYFLRRADVLNRGLSGYNTRWALPAIQAIMAGETVQRTDQSKDDVLFATLWFGANDAAVVTDGSLEKLASANPDVLKTLSDNEYQHVSVGEFEKNLETIARTILKGTNCLILLTPPCVGEKNRMGFLIEQDGFAAELGEDQLEIGGEEQKTRVSLTSSTHLDRSNKSVVQYRDAVKRVTEKLTAESAENAWTICVIDTYALFFEEREAILHPDGLHINWKGEQIIFKAILDQVLERKKDQGVLAVEEGAKEAEATRAGTEQDAAEAETAAEEDGFSRFSVIPDPVTKHYGHGRSQDSGLPMPFPYWNDREKILSSSSGA